MSNKELRDRVAALEVELAVEQAANQLLLTKVLAMKVTLHREKVKLEIEDEVAMVRRAIEQAHGVVRQAEEERVEESEESASESPAPEVVA